MGMFDTVWIDDVEYQTKDAECLLDTYEVIEVDGARRLYRQTYQLQPIPDDERDAGPLAPIFRREDTGSKWLSDANGVLACSRVRPREPTEGDLLLFVRDGVVIAERQVDERFVRAGLCLGHSWPRADELGVSADTRAQGRASMVEPPGERDVDVLLGDISPQVRDGVVAVATVPDGRVPHGVTPLATVVEPEGLTVVADIDELGRVGLSHAMPSRLVTLRATSSLEAVGFMAAISAELAAVGIPCNVLAGFHHDHLLVGVDRLDEVMAVLTRDLSRQ